MRAVAILLLLLLSVGVVAGYPKFYEHSKSWYKDFDDNYQENFFPTRTL